MPRNGMRVSITLKPDMRYTGTIKNLPSEQGTFITLKGVDSHGTEGRKADARQEVVGKRDVADYMRFPGCRVKNLEVIVDSENENDADDEDDADEDDRPSYPEFQGAPFSSGASSLSSSLASIVVPYNTPCPSPRSSTSKKMSDRKQDIMFEERALLMRELLAKQLEDFQNKKEVELAKRKAPLTLGDDGEHHHPAVVRYMLDEESQGLEAESNVEDAGMSEWDECEVSQEEEVEDFEEYEVV